MDQSSSHFHAAPAEREKFELGTGEFPSETLQPLPDSYGDNRLVLLPRDPFVFFSYWEYTPDRVDKLRQQFGVDVWEKGVLVLRTYDVTSLPPNGVEAAPYFDTEIHSRDVRKLYVNVPTPGHAFVCELGIRLPDGRFLALLRSNRIRLPAGRVSEKTDIEWMKPISAEEEQQQFQTLSAGVGNISSGSAEFAKGMAQRWEFLRSVFSGSSANLPGSGTSPWIQRAPGRDEENRS